MNINNTNYTIMCSYISKTETLRIVLKIIFFFEVKKWEINLWEHSRVLHLEQFFFDNKRRGLFSFFTNFSPCGGL